MTWVSYEKHIWLIGGWSWIPFQGLLLLVLGRFFFGGVLGSTGIGWGFNKFPKYRVLLKKIFTSK